MILDKIVGWICSALSALVGLLPDADASKFIESIGLVMSNLGAMNYFLPIAETTGIVASIMLVFPVFLGVSLTLWVLAQIRGSSSRG